MFTLFSTQQLPPSNRCSSLPLSSPYTWHQPANPYSVLRAYTQDPGLLLLLSYPFRLLKPEFSFLPTRCFFRRQSSELSFSQAKVIIEKEVSDYFGIKLEHVIFHKYETLEWEKGNIFFQRDLFASANDLWKLSWASREGTPTKEHIELFIPAN